MKAHYQEMVEDLETIAHMLNLQNRSPQALDAERAILKAARRLRQLANEDIAQCPQ